jgi:aryl-alcohol dehydrogenase-like predicted oxidoreductase
MKYRTFGKSGWQVSEIGYGMWGMGDWTGSDDDESLHSLQLAVDMGCNFFDTAWAYGEGHSERLLAQLIRANPDKELKVATKIPPKNFEWPSRRDFSLDDCFPPEHIKEYVHKSLQNLEVNTIDLIQFHTWEDGWLQDEGWLKAMEDLKQEGVIELVGISLNRWEPWNGVKAVRSGLIDAVQVIYNIFDQAPEDELLPACQEMGVGVIARVPFDEGSLTGNLTLASRWPEGDWRNSYFVPENLRASVERADQLKPLVPEHMTMAEMALRFILGESRVSTIIPGMRQPEHVRQNLNTSQAGPLASDLQVELQKHRWDRQPTEWSQ